MIRSQLFKTDRQSFNKTKPNYISALNETASILSAQGMSLADYNYDNKAVADIMQEQMEKVKFLGISVSFFYIRYLPLDCLT